MMRRNSENIVENLRNARAMLDDCYINGELSDDDGGVCAIGALSTVVCGSALYNTEGQHLGPELEWLRRAIDEAPENDEELQEVLSTHRRLSVEDIVVAINDNAGKEAVLRLFDAAICLSSAECAIPPPPEPSEAAPGQRPE